MQIVYDLGRGLMCGGVLLAFFFVLLLAVMLGSRAARRQEAGEAERRVESQRPSAQAPKPVKFERRVIETVVLDPRHGMASKPRHK